MPATIPNISKGRLNEFARRVKTPDPSGSGFVIVALRDTSLQTLAQLRDHETLAAITAAGNTECSASGYGRIVLQSADISLPTVDHSGDKQTFDVGDYNFGALASGQTIAASVMCYAPSTGGADSTFIPCHISIPAVAVATNGETFHWRTPSGLWEATE